MPIGRRCRRRPACSAPGACAPGRFIALPGPVRKAAPCCADRAWSPPAPTAPYPPAPQPDVRAAPGVPAVPRQSLPAQRPHATDRNSPIAGLSCLQPRQALRSGARSDPLSACHRPRAPPLAPRWPGLPAQAQGQGQEPPRTLQAPAPPMVVGAYGPKQALQWMRHPHLVAPQPPGNHEAPARQSCRARRVRVHCVRADAARAVHAARVFHPSAAPPPHPPFQLPGPLLHWQHPGATGGLRRFRPGHRTAVRARCACHCVRGRRALPGLRRLHRCGLPRSLLRPVLRVPVRRHARHVPGDCRHVRHAACVRCAARGPSCPVLHPSRPLRWYPSVGHPLPSARGEQHPGVHRRVHRGHRVRRVPRVARPPGVPLHGPHRDLRHGHRGRLVLDHRREQDDLRACLPVWRGWRERPAPRARPAWHRCPAGP